MTIDQAIDKVRLLGSYARIEAVLDLYFPMNMEDRGAEWLALLGREWFGFDNVGEYLDDLLDILPYNGPVLEMMDEAERTAYASLPEEVIVFRGAGRINRHGVSWSLDEAVARKFPAMFRYWQKHPMLYTATVPKNRILAVKLGRGEQEVITFGARIVKSRRLKRVRWSA